MIINNIHIKNCGPHEESKINLTDPVTAVVGSNGSGKTYLIESIAACFYGVWPSRGNMVNGMTQDHFGKSEIIIEFEMGGKKYKAERAISRTFKTVSSEAYLYEKEKEGEWETISGPKIKLYDESISNLLGDQKTFFSSVFSSQSSYMDFVDASPATRKRILYDFLNLSKYEEKSEIYKGKANRLNYELETIVSDADKIEAKFSANDGGQNIRNWEDFHSFVVAIKNDEGIFGDIENIHDSTQLFQKQYDKNAIKIQELEDHNSNIISLMEKNSDVLTKAKIDQSKFDQYQQSRQKNSQEIQTLKHKIIQSKEALQEKPKLIEIQKKREQVIAVDQKKLEEKTKKENEAKAFLADAKLTKQKYDALNEQCAVLSCGDFEAENCKKCQFLENAFFAKEKIKSITLPSEIEIAAAQKELATKIQYQDVPSDQSDKLRNIERIEYQLSEQQRVLKDLIAERDYFVSNPQKCNEDKITLLEAEKTKYKDAISKNQSEIKKIRDKNNNIVVHINEIKKIYENCKTYMDSMVAINGKKSDLKKEFKIYSYLQKAYSPNGIPALLIDSAIPRIQNIATELLSISMDGKFSIEIKTQKKLKSGALSESLEILIRDCEGTNEPRDIAQFSGGEQKILKTIIRITLAIYQSTLNQKIETLCLDESFDSLDGDNMIRVINVLNFARKYFKKIIFVSHNEDILNDFEAKIYCTKKNGVTTVQ